MKPAMFRYKMAQAGYSDHEVEIIEDCMDVSEPVVLDDYRYAICEYAKVSKNVKMVPVYVGLVEDLYLNSELSWEDAVSWVLRIIVGWGL